MKNKYTVIKIIILPLLLSIIIGFNYNNSDEISTAVKTIQVKEFNYAADLVSKAGDNFEKANIFSISNKDNSKALNVFTKTASFLTLNSNSIRNLYSANKQNILLTIPVSANKNIELELVQENIFSSGFEVRSMDGLKYDYKPGLYYYGIIKGDNSSWASISIFENSVMGVISNNDGNYVLGTIKNDKNNPTNDYMFYNDRDLKVKNNFKCDVEDYYGKHFIGSSYKHSGSQKDATHDTVRVTFVADNSTFVDVGGTVPQLVNFITGMFASVSLCYKNINTPGGVPTAISKIYYYPGTDPYSYYNDPETILKIFGSSMLDTTKGDLYHLISTGHGGQLGGIAWINVLCQPFNPGDSSGRFAFSNIDNSYAPFPTYSWTVNVVAHELGHNFGSMHTHACVWPVYAFGGIGAIDSCYYAESGNCFNTNEVHPILNGTLMSYCHLQGSVILNFGTLPGDTITLGYQRAVCLDSALNSSELPLAYLLMQNYPNPFNPSTTISFALPQEGFVTLTVYDITGREVTKLINNQFYNAGIFRTSFNTAEHNLASGVYLYKMDVINNNSSKYSQIKKMVLVK
jgi:hypothetical protein